jgi:hypothetical protein
LAILFEGKNLLNFGIWSLAFVLGLTLKFRQKSFRGTGMATLKNLLMIGGGWMAKARIDLNRQHEIFNILGVIDPLAATRDAISEMDLQAFSDLEECGSVLHKAVGFWISSMTSTHGP